MKRKTHNILLVEPPYPSTHLPFGLQKIATYHLNLGDNVEFIHEHPKKYFTRLKLKHYHRIYITSVFTYHLEIVVNTVNYLKRLFPDSKIMVGGPGVTIMPEYVEKKTGIVPWIGLYPKVQEQIPNYSLFPKDKRICAVTVLGCRRSCEFCAVKTLEPQFTTKTNWRGQILAGYKTGLRHIDFRDNNFLMAPWSHKVAVVDFVKNLDNKLTVDFGQSLDCRLFHERDAKLLSQLNWPTFRFAFDGLHEDGYFQKAVELVKKYNISRDITSYTLYNFHEKPEEFWYRLNEQIKNKANAFPMKFQPYDCLVRNKYIGEHWTRKMLSNFKDIMHKSTPTGLILHHSAYKTNLIGRTPEEFVELLNADDVSKQYFSSMRSSKRVLNTTLGLTDRSKIELSKKKAVKIGILNKEGKKKSKRSKGVRKDYR